MYKLIGKFIEIDGEETRNISELMDKYKANSILRSDIQILKSTDGTNYVIAHNSNYFNTPKMECEFPKVGVKKPLVNIPKDLLSGVQKNMQMLINNQKRK